MWRIVFLLSNCLTLTPDVYQSAAQTWAHHNQVSRILSQCEICYKNVALTHSELTIPNKYHFTGTVIYEVAPLDYENGKVEAAVLF